MPMKLAYLMAGSAVFHAHGAVVFEDNFDNGIDFSTWKHEITMGGGGNWEFEYYTNNRSNSFVDNGTLFLMPTLTADKLGADEVSGAVPTTMDIWGSQPADTCTGNSFYGCSRASGGGNVINPIQSARLRTAGTFQFRYGRVEVEAKLPKGDWLWPAMWLLPADQVYGQWPASGEIDLMESRGNAPGYPSGGSDCFGSTLHFGPFFPEDAYEEATSQYCGEDLSEDFHTYGLVWTETAMYTYIDSEDNKVLDLTIGDGDSFWDKGGWTATGDAPATKATTKTVKIADAAVAGSSSNSSSGGAKYRHERKTSGSGSSLDEMGPVDNPWRGQGANAPFDAEFHFVFNLAVGGTNGYFPDGEGGKMWSDQSTTAFQDFNNALPSVLPTWTSPALQVRRVTVTDDV